MLLFCCLDSAVPVVLMMLLPLLCCWCRCCCFYFVATAPVFVFVAALPILLLTDAAVAVVFVDGVAVIDNDVVTVFAVVVAAIGIVVNRPYPNILVSDVQAFLTMSQVPEIKQVLNNFLTKVHPIQVHDL